MSGYTHFEEFAKAMPANTAQRAEQAKRKLTRERHSLRANDDGSDRGREGVG